MDLLTLQKRNQENANRLSFTSSDSEEQTNDRLNDIIKRVNSNKPIKNKWGGKDYPIDVADYGQFLSSLQSIAWVLRDLGYDIKWLTRGGLTYDNTSYILYPNLFDQTGQKIVAMVAIGKDDLHYRFNRDGKTLRIRKFNNINRAIAPMRDGDTTGTKTISAQTVKEIVRVMKTQTLLDPSDKDSLRRWGKIVQGKSLKPVGAASLKTQLKLEFKKA